MRYLQLNSDAPPNSAFAPAGALCTTGAENAPTSPGPRSPRTARRQAERRVGSLPVGWADSPPGSPGQRAPSAPRGSTCSEQGERLDLAWPPARHAAPAGPARPPSRPARERALAAVANPRATRCSARQATAGRHLQACFQHKTKTQGPRPARGPPAPGTRRRGGQRDQENLCRMNLDLTRFT